MRVNSCEKGGPFTYVSIGTLPLYASEFSQASSLATLSGFTTACPLGHFEVHGPLPGDENYGEIAMGKLGARLRLRFPLRSLGSDLTLV